MNNPFLFLATVIKVNYENILATDGDNKQYTTQAGTIEVASLSGKGQLTNVRVIVPGTSNLGVVAGWVLYPSVGDTVVCGYLEGMSGYAVCLGAIYGNNSNKPSAQGRRQQDIVLHHPSNSFIRMRNKSNTDTKIDTDHSLSEVRIQHRSGCNIVMEDFLDGDDIKTTVSITGPQNTVVNIDATGNVNIISQKDMVVKTNRYVVQNYLPAAQEQTRELLETGKDEVLTNRNIPYDTFTGRPIRGTPWHLSTNKIPPTT